MPRERPADLGPIITASELAQHMGVDRHTIIDSWVPRGCPYARKADVRRGVAWGFRVAAVQEWRDGVDGPGATVEPGTPSKKISDARRAAAEARMAEIQLAKLEGSLVEIGVIEDEVANAFAKVRSRVMSCVAELDTELSTLTDSGLRQAKARDILGEALEDLVRRAAEEADEEEAPTPAQEEEDPDEEPEDEEE